MTGQIDHLSDDFHYSTARVSSDGVTYIPCFLREWPSVLPVLPERTRELYLAKVTVQVQKRAHIADPAVRAKWEQSLGAKSAPGSAPRLAPEWSAFKGRPTACSA